MTYRAIRNLFSLAVIAAAALPAIAATNWIQPTPDELKMTADPKAPNAPAVYLNYEEIVNIPAHFHRVYARVKILDEEGKQRFSEFEIPYGAGQAAIRGIEGRTIHADGSIVPFSGQAYDKELVKSGGTRIMAKVFAMPDVQVGSIVEYRYETQYDDQWVFPPEFTLQQQLYVHHGHYVFIPMEISLESSRGVVIADAQGKPHLANRLLYDSALPPGAKLQETANGYDLTENDVQPIVEEPYSPPLNSFSYRLFFYYSADWTGKDYWAAAGRGWSREFDHFAEPSAPIQQAVAQLVSPGDSSDARLHKIYAAVMTVDNTRFSRGHSAAEDKAAGTTVQSAADVWAQKRGTPNQIDRLFVAMTRAAGFKASGMIVTERDQRILNANYLDWQQLTDEIAIVNVDGKDLFFDPGQRYCEYSKLQWRHTQVLGMRQVAGGGTDAVLTPAADFRDTHLQRIAQLQLGPNGAVQGTIHISMSGVEALRWRQRVLQADEQEARQEFDNDLRREVPPGIQVHTDQFVGLADFTQPLVAAVTVTGSMGTETGKRIILPGTFFEASVKSPFPADNRINPVDLRYPYMVQDLVKITLPAQLAPAGVPQSTQIPFPQNAQYMAKYAMVGTTYEQGRLLAVGNTLYKQEQYGDLRGFFQKISAQDQQPLVLQRIATTAGQ